MATNTFENIHNLIHDVHDKYVVLCQENKQLKESNETLTNSNVFYKQQNEDLNEKIIMLQNKIDCLEDDRKELTKVSSIVSLDKQNQQLKKEIENLHDKINKLLETKEHVVIQESSSSPTPILPESHVVIGYNLTSNTKEATEAVEEPNKSPEVKVTLHSDDMVEKTIKSVKYYVSQDNLIYVKNDDGSVGENVGKLTKTPDNKTKVTWLKPTSNSL